MGLWALLLTCVQLPLFAQLPQEYPPRRSLQEAQQLYRDAKYAAAYQLFEQYLADSAAFNPSASGRAHRAEAAYLQAFCSYHLLQDRADLLLQQVLRAHPTHVRANQARYYLGRLYYLEQNYTSALLWLEAVSPNRLEPAEQQEWRFAYGYSRFATGSEGPAAEILRPLTRELGPYHDPANYYAGVASYNAGKYREALKHFRAIAETPDYRTQVPVYIVQSLLQLQAFDELDRYGKQILEQEGIQSKDLIRLKIGEGLFENGDYAASLPYLETYLQQAQNPEAGARYRLGLAYANTEEPRKAARALGPVTRLDDTLGQAAAYAAGFAWLQAGQPDSALTAFRRVRQLPYKPALAADALWQEAQVLTETEAYRQAWGVLQQIRESDAHTQHPQQWALLAGEVLLANSEPEQALAALRLAPEDSPRIQQLRQSANLQAAAAPLADWPQDSAQQTELLRRVLPRLERALQGPVARTRQQAQYLLGELALRQGQDSLAMVQLRELLSQLGATDSLRLPTLLSLGWAQYRLQSWVPAQLTFEQVTQIPSLPASDPRHQTAQLRAADCRIMRKDYPGAAQVYRKLAQNNSPQTGDYANYMLGVALHRQERYNKAAQVLEGFLQTWDNSPYRQQAYDLLGEIVLEWLGQPGKAVDVAKRQLREFPQGDYSLAAYRRLAKAQIQQEAYQAAIQNLKTLLYNYGDSEALGSLEYLVALEELSTTDFDAIKAEYRRRAPGAREALSQSDLRSAQTSYNNGQYVEALTQVKEVLAATPPEPLRTEALLLRAQSYEKTGDTALAVADYQAVEGNFRAGRELRADALLGLAELRYAQQQYAQAAEHFRTVINLAPNGFDRERAQFGLASALIAQEAFQQAETQLNSLLSLPDVQPGSRKLARLQLLRLEYLRGNRQQALGGYRQYVDQAEADNKLDSYWAEARYMLAALQLEELQDSQAIRTALALVEENPRYNEWQARAEILLAGLYRELGADSLAEPLLVRVLRSGYIDTQFPQIRREAADLLNAIRRDRKARQQAEQDTTGQAALPLEPTPTPGLSLSQSLDATQTRLLKPVALDMGANNLETTITKARQEALPPVQRPLPVLGPPTAHLPADRLAYTSLELEYLPTPRPLRTTVQSLPRESWPELFPFYLRASLGRWITPRLDLYLNRGRARKSDYGLALHHSSTATGHVDFANFGETRGRLFARHLFGASKELRGHLSGDYTVLNPFGDILLQADPARADTAKRKFFRLEAALGFEELDPTADWGYGMDLRYRRASSVDNQREDVVLAQPYVNYRWAEGWRGQLGLDFFFSGQKPQRSRASQTRSFLGFTPSVRYQADRLDVQVGLQLGFLNEADSLQEAPTGQLETAGGFFAFPDLQLQVRLAPDNWALTAKVGGQLHYHTLYSLLPVNRYLGDNINLASTAEWLHGRLGVQGHAGSFQLQAEGYYRLRQNDLFFVSSGFPANSAQAGTFAPVYANTSNEYGAELQAAWAPHYPARLQMRVLARGFGLDGLAEAWHRPNLRADLSLGYTFWNRLQADLNLAVIGPRAVGLDAAGATLQAEVFADLGLKLEYRFSNYFSLYAQAWNLLNLDYQRWLNTPERPLDFAVGGSLALPAPR